MVINTLFRKERNVLFNNTLNTFYLRLYDVRHMVKDLSDSERGNPLMPHRLLLLINSFWFEYGSVCDPCVFEPMRFYCISFQL